MSKLFLVMGKSATGKDHIYKAVLEKLENKLKPVVSYTTRPMRAGETEGVEYHFVSEKRMEELKSQGLIIECRCYNTVMGPWYYFNCDDGQVSADGDNKILIVTPEAYAGIVKYFGEELVRPVYIECPDVERIGRALKREAKQLKPNIKEMCRRYLADEEDFAEEFLASLGIEKRFVNMDFDKCVEEIVSYIKEEGEIL